MALSVFVPMIAVKASAAADSVTAAAPVMMAWRVSCQESVMFWETSYQIRYPTPETQRRMKRAMPRAASPSVSRHGSGLSLEGWGCRFCCVVFSLVVITGPHVFPRCGPV